LFYIIIIAAFIYRFLVIVFFLSFKLAELG
jgi:hypothetical protein